MFTHKDYNLYLVFSTPCLPLKPEPPFRSAGTLLQVRGCKEGKGEQGAEIWDKEMIENDFIRRNFLRITFLTT